MDLLPLQAPEASPSSNKDADVPLSPVRALLSQSDMGNAAIGDLLRLSGRDAQDTEAHGGGVHTSSQPLRHHRQISESFGPDHGLEEVRVHRGTEAREASARLGARAATFGDHILDGGAMDLKTEAHEAAHVVQQAHGLSAESPELERHADMVAERVARGQSAAGLLSELPRGASGSPGLQRKKEPSADNQLRDNSNSGKFSDIVSEDYHELMKTTAESELNPKLQKERGQSVTNAYDSGHGNYNFDEYAIDFDKLPEGMTEEDLLQAFLKDPDSFVAPGENDKGHANYEDWKKAAQTFDDCNSFTRVDKERNPLKGAAPAQGDVYDIDIWGPDNGDVVNSKMDKNSATFSTMTDLHLGGEHPVAGNRKFGIEKLKNGKYRFYTRGFDRAGKWVTDNEYGRDLQDESWTAMMKALSYKLNGKAAFSETAKDGSTVESFGHRKSYSAEQLLKKKDGSDVSSPSTGPIA